MRLPRQVSGDDLIKGLQRIGYSVSRQSGSHVRLTHGGPPEHHITVPRHDSLKVGTISAILTDVAAHLKTAKSELIQRIF